MSVYVHKNVGDEAFLKSVLHYIQGSCDLNLDGWDVRGGGFMGKTLLHPYDKSMKRIVLPLKVIVAWLS